MELPSADRSFAIIAIHKNLLTEQQAESILHRVNLARPINPEISAEALIRENGWIDENGISRVLRTRGRHGRACRLCHQTTFLMPGERSVTTPCEHCGGELLSRREMTQMTQLSQQQLSQQQVSSPASQENWDSSEQGIHTLTPKQFDIRSLPPQSSTTTSQDIENRQDSAQDLIAAAEDIPASSSDSGPLFVDEIPENQRRSDDSVPVFNEFDELYTAPNSHTEHDLESQESEAVEIYDEGDDLAAQFEDSETAPDDEQDESASFDIDLDSHSEFELEDLDQQAGDLAELDRVLINRVIDGFRIVKPLSQGGMGVLYLASHEILERKLVIKTLQPDHARDPHKRARFLREAKSAAKLDHPNIVPVLNISSLDDGMLYLTMPFVDGENMENYIGENGPLGLKHFIKVFTELASALESAHRHKVVHRDIKPSNIILDTDGHARLTDFGLAWLDDVDEISLTTSGVFVGTPLYMAPEAGLTDNIDGRCDIYTLGLTAIFALTGLHPFQKAKLTDLISKRAHSRLFDPRRFNNEITDQLAEILSMCLAIDPEERYQNAKALLEDLERYAQGQPLQASGRSIWYQASTN